jgi:hypothetical protein
LSGCLIGISYGDIEDIVTPMAKHDIINITPKTTIYIGTSLIKKIYGINNTNVEIISIIPKVWIFISYFLELSKIVNTAQLKRSTIATPKMISKSVFGSLIQA